MPPLFDDFVHISGPAESAAPRTSLQPNWQPGVPNDFLENTKGARLFTEGLIVDSIRRHHPKYHLTVTPGYTCDLLGFANAQDDVTYFPHGNPTENLVERQFIPPARRYNDEAGGSFNSGVVFGCYDYIFKGKPFLVYIVEGSDGGFGKTRYNYILVEGLPSDLGQEVAQKQTDELIAAASKWALELHDEVLIFDSGMWQKNRELWQNIQKSNWEDVILEKSKKDAIIDDVTGFFNKEKRYQEFGVPWKRGVIFYGPPGNGKTISTKALMHDVSKSTSPGITSLYVKSFKSFMGPEYGIRQIFLKARQMAPCLLIFEDIDSLVDVSVRSYFLNEVDGLESNHGILMIGSTNHLERLDPGIAKRPSRFDRKYIFEDPSREERILYCEYWRNKLQDNKKIEFPREMSARIADITDDFSFAYMKEAFVAALLVIVARTDEKKVFKHREDPLSGNILWKEIKRQVENLRKEMEEESGEALASTRSGMWPSLSSILDEESRPMEIRREARLRYM